METSQEELARHQLLRGSVSGFVGLAGGYLSQYLFQASVCRVLGSEASGVFFAFYAFAILMTIVARAGLDKTGLKAISICYEKGESACVRRIALRLSTVVALLSCFWVALLLPVKYKIASAFGAAQEIKSLTILLCAIPGFAVSTTLAEFLRGMKLVGRSSLVQLVLIYGVSLVALWLCYLIWGTDMRFVSSCLLLGTVFSAGVGGWFVLSNTTGQNLPLVTARKVELFSGAPYMFWASLMFYGMAGMDLLILGYLKPGGETAYYVAATRTAMITSLGLAAVNSIIVPMVASIYHDEKRERLQALVVMGARWCLTISALLSALILAVGPLVLRIFGPEFAASFPLLLVLLGGQLINSGSGAVMFILLMSGNERKAAAVLSLTNLLMLPSYFLLVPSMGAMGAALVTTGGLIAWNLGMLWHTKRSVGIRAYADNIHRVLVFLLISGTPALVSYKNGATHVLVLVTFLIILPAISWSYLLASEDRQIIRGLLKKNGAGLIYKPRRQEYMQ